MALDDDNDWAPGQPPPWLAQYGVLSPAEQQQQQLAEYGPAINAIGDQLLLPPAPPAPPPPPPPPAPAPAPAPKPAPTTKSTLGPRGRISTIGTPTGDEVPGSAMPPDESSASIPPPIDSSLAGAPQPGLVGQSAPGAFVPPWLAQQEQPSEQAAKLTPDEESQIEIDDGGGEPREQALTRLLLDPNTPLEGRQRAFAGLTPEQRTNVVNTADPKQLAAIASASMEPAELATIAVRHQQAQFHEQSAAQLTLAQKADEDARRNWETYQSVMQKAAADTNAVDAEAQALSKQKIDTDEHGVGHFIASVLTSAVGGAMSQYTGGRNLALEQLDKRTQARIDAQKADIENRWKGVGFKRNLIAEHIQRTGDMYRAQEVYRLSQYDRALGELQVKAQDYDPQGTTGLKIAGSIQQVLAQRAAAKQAYNKQAIEDGLKQAQTLQALASAAKTQQETVGLQIKQSGIGAGAAKSKPEYGTIYNNADFATLPEAIQHRGFQLPSKNGQPGGWVLANNDEVAKDASHLVKMYNQADYDLNELQKISVERNGAKSAGGSLWKQWQDTQEQHYQQLLLDVANVYGMMIHGRAPTAGVMDEIIKVAPELKSAWQRGDTTQLIDKFRNDIDNRMSLEVQDFTGGAHRLTSSRPVAAESNANTIGSDLTTPAIKGDLGYARFDIRNYGEGIDRLFKEFSENPGLGGSAAFATQMDKTIAAQQKAAETIRTDMEKIAAKPKRTSEENAQLIAARKALADREEAIREANDAKKRNVEAEAQRKAAEERAEMEGQAAADDRSGF